MWRARLLRYAAIQFVVLTAIAMQLFPGGYRFFGNFFSELGATRTWEGAPNHTCMVLFAISLGSVGVATVAFAGAWRQFAFRHGKLRVLGIAGQGFGTCSGLAFLAVAATPVDVALHVHNGLVVAAFGLLLGYAATLTIVWWKNGATRVQLWASVAYVLLVCAYVVSIVFALRTGVTTEHGRELLVASQKAIVYASMIYIFYVTFAVAD